MPLQLHIEADTPQQLMTYLKAIMSNLSDEMAATAAVPSPQGARRGRPPRDDNKTATAPLAGDPLSAPAPAPAIDPDLAAAATVAEAPKSPANADEFVAEVRKLLGKGKDDAVRGKLKELGFERVRDVPADRFTAILAELVKV
jgi:hypothetical protein